MIVLKLTRSQHMALLDLIADHLRTPDATESYIDCSVHPPVETTVGVLLALVLNANEEKKP
jgi:hypothetical protein